MERLQKVIAGSGYTSRRKAEELIQQGKVTVNGQKVTELGTKVGFQDLIQVEGKMIEQAAEGKEYYLLNKPRGVISTTQDEKGRKTVVDLINTKTRIYPIGRLDYDTTGLLLLTNDGEFANMMMHPRFEVEKTYIAKVKGIIDADMIKTLKKGILIDSKKCIPKRIKLRKLDKKNEICIVEIVIVEGKYHQVKRMFEIIGCEVLKLKRETYGLLTLDGVKPGEYRELNKKEIKQLYNLTSHE